MTGFPCVCGEYLKAIFAGVAAARHMHINAAHFHCGALHKAERVHITIHEWVQGGCRAAACASKQGRKQRV